MQRSFNGRTMVSKTIYVGSNPTRCAIDMKDNKKIKQNRAEWIDESDKFGPSIFYHCSNCGERALIEEVHDGWLDTVSPDPEMRYAKDITHKESRLTKYCPFCGKRMKNFEDFRGIEQRKKEERQYQRKLKEEERIRKQKEEEWKKQQELKRLKDKFAIPLAIYKMNLLKDE